MTTGKVPLQDQAIGHDRRSISFAETVAEGVPDFEARVEQEQKTFSGALRTLRSEDGKKFIQDLADAATPADQAVALKGVTDFVAQRGGAEQARQVSQLAQDEQGIQHLADLAGSDPSRAVQQLTQAHARQAPGDAIAQERRHADLVSAIIADPDQKVLNQLERPWLSLPWWFGDATQAMGLNPETPSPDQLIMAAINTDPEAAGFGRLLTMKEVQGLSSELRQSLTQAIAGGLAGSGRGDLLPDLASVTGEGVIFGDLKSAAADIEKLEENLASSVRSGLQQAGLVSVEGHELDIYELARIEQEKADKTRILASTTDPRMQEKLGKELRDVDALSLEVQNNIPQEYQEDIKTAVKGEAGRVALGHQTPAQGHERNQEKIADLRAKLSAFEPGDPRRRPLAHAIERVGFDEDRVSKIEKYCQDTSTGEEDLAHADAGLLNEGNQRKLVAEDALLAELSSAVKDNLILDPDEVASLTKKLGGEAAFEEWLPKQFSYKGDTLKLLTSPLEDRQPGVFGDPGQSLKEQVGEKEAVITTGLFHAAEGTTGSATEQASSPEVATTLAQINKSADHQVHTMLAITATLNRISDKLSN